MEEDTDKTQERVAMGVATGWVILRHRHYRRNLLFVSTLITLVLVFVGAVPLNRFLSSSPIWFALFWIVVFLGAGFVLLLAIYDLLRIRSEHRQRLDQLERELADAAEEARRLAKEKLDEDSKS